MEFRVEFLIMRISTEQDFATPASVYLVQHTDIHKCNLVEVVRIS